ncbi:MAG TPA: hypothetical protein PLV92_18065, partial [Pirellulaceae bacterium]|nr:hypothetical protein [Pirellulaceae bacterium]
MECTTSLKTEPGCRRSGDATHESLAAIVIGCWSTAAVFVLTAAFLVWRRLFVGVAPASDAVLATSALVVPAAVNASRLLCAWASRLLASSGRLSPELARRSWLATAATLSAAALLWGLALSFPQPNAWPLVLWWSTLAAGEAWWWTWSACLRRSTADIKNSDSGKHASGQGSTSKTDASPSR